MQKLLIITFFLVAINSDPSPPYWGGNPQYNVWVNFTNPSPKGNWKMHYYYDSIVNASRYEHYSP